MVLPSPDYTVYTRDIAERDIINIGIDTKNDLLNPDLAKDMYLVMSLCVRNYRLRLPDDGPRCWRHLLRLASHHVSAYIS